MWWTRRVGPKTTSSVVHPTDRASGRPRSSQVSRHPCRNRCWWTGIGPDGRDSLWHWSAQSLLHLAKPQRLARNWRSSDCRKPGNCRCCTSCCWCPWLHILTVKLQLSGLSVDRSTERSNSLPMSVKQGLRLHLLQCILRLSWSNCAHLRHAAGLSVGGQTGAGTRSYRAHHAGCLWLLNRSWLKLL